MTFFCSTTPLGVAMEGRESIHASELLRAARPPFWNLPVLEDGDLRVVLAGAGLAQFSTSPSRKLKASLSTPRLLTGSAMAMMGFLSGLEEDSIIRMRVLALRVPRDHDY